MASGVLVDALQLSEGTWLISNLSHRDFSTSSPVVWKRGRDRVLRDGLKQASLLSDGKMYFYCQGPNKRCSESKHHVHVLLHAAGKRLIPYLE